MKVFNGVPRAADHLLSRQRIGWEKLSVESLTAFASETDFIDAARMLGLTVTIKDGETWIILNKVPFCHDKYNFGETT